MKRFILIDQSISTIGGHHVEYARRVLDAAAEQGYQPLLVTNRKLQGIGDFPCQAVPVYRYKFWTSSQDSRLVRLLQFIKETYQGFKTRLILKFGYSDAGVMWLSRHHLADVLHKTPEIGWREFLLGIVVYLGGAVLRMMQVVKQAIPFKPYLCGVWHAVVRLIQHLLAPLLLPFKLPKWLKLKLADQRKMSSFLADTRKLFQRIGIMPDDIVFIPTIGESELMGLANYLEDYPSAGKLSWHLLFRRNLFTGRDPDYAGQEEDLRRTMQVFRQVQALPCSKAIHFYTDTEQLTRQYNWLGIQPFMTLPVPVDSAYIQEKQSSGHPLRVAYAGDARAEKGYHLLPHLVQDTWLTHGKMGKVVFEFQSNYNVRDGEPEAVVGRTQLLTYPSELVTLHTEALNQEAYRQLIQRADVILIPYTSETYYGRSSGVLVEALTAGIPVIVPAGTWMALQLNEANAKHVASKLENNPAVMTYRFNDLPWAYTVDEKRWVTARNGISPSIPYPGISSQLDVPAHMHHLAIQLQQVSEQAGCFVQMTLEQLDARRYMIGEEAAILGGDGHSAVLMRLSEGCRRILLTISNAYRYAPAVFTEMKLSLLQLDADTPLSAVGCIFADEADISRKLVEVLDHHAHYLAGASAMSHEVAAYHTPNRLVEDIIATAKNEPDAQPPAGTGGRSLA